MVFIKMFLMFVQGFMMVYSRVACELEFRRCTESKGGAMKLLDVSVSVFFARYS